MERGKEKGEMKSDREMGKGLNREEAKMRDRVRRERESVILSRRDYTWMRVCARDSVSVE